MAEISGLSVKVSAAVAGFNAGMSRAQDAAGDLALSLRRLDFATEAAESGLDSTGRSATTTSLQFGALSFASSILNTRLFGLSVTMWGLLLPALAALSTALVPLVAAMGGFITIAGAIGGIGLLGTIGAIATHTEELKNSLQFLKNAVLDTFGPAFDLAFSVLTQLAFELGRVIETIEPSEETLSRLAGNFAQLGHELIDLVPAFAQLASDIALRFLPPFVTFAQRVLPDVPPLLRSLTNAFADVLPILVGFGKWFNQISPDLYEFGLTVLKSVANGLGVVGDAIGEVLSIGASSDSLSEFLKRMVTSAVTWLKNEGLPMINGLAGDILDQLETYFEEGGADDLASVVSTFMGSLADALSNISSEDINKVADQLGVVLSGILATQRKALQSGEAGALGTEISRLAGTVLGVVFEKLVTFANSDEFAQHVATLSTAIASGLAKGIQIAAANALSEVTLTDIAKAAQMTQSPAAAIGQELTKQTQPILGDLTGTDGVPSLVGSSGEAPIQINIEGDTDVVRNVSAEVVDSTNRRSRRNQGRRANPN